MLLRFKDLLILPIVEQAGAHVTGTEAGTMPVNRIY